jgi:hypothetical protein
MIRNRPGDLEKAKTLLGEALVAYRDIGMPRHEQLTQTMLDQIA